MVTLMSRHQSARWKRRQGDTNAADDDGASASATSPFPAGAALGVAGLATASTAITACMAISQSPSSSDAPAVDEDDSSRCYYHLALSAGLFYAGIAELGAAVWVMDEPHGRVAAGRRLMYASLVPLTAAAVGLAVAALFW